MPIKKRKIVENVTNREENTNSNREEKPSIKNTYKFNKEIDTEFIFNKVLNESLRNKNIYKKKDNVVNPKSKFKTVEEYQSDFEDIISFRRKITKREMEDINMLVYHNENNDGFLSACIAYHFLKELDPNKIIYLEALKPIHGKFFKIENPEKYNQKHILILDLDYTADYLEELSKIAKDVIVIDDHQKDLETPNNSSKLHIFRGRDERHATCAYTWKFFYPKEEVPLAVQFIDNNDIKLFLPFFPNNIAHTFAQAIGHRYSHNKSPIVMQKKRSGEIFEEFWDVISEKYLSLKYLIFIGKYYDEVVESLKNQIAINAKPAKFQGYDVAVLNFNAPGIKKQVGRQIMSNYKKMGIPIKFCVLWGYEYTNQCYDVTIMDDHTPYSTINLRDIAVKLGNIGGHRKGGGGHKHEGHFYWPHNDKFDIWDLFKKKYL